MHSKTLAIAMCFATIASACTGTRFSASGRKSKPASGSSANAPKDDDDDDDDTSASGGSPAASGSGPVPANGANAGPSSGPNPVSEGAIPATPGRSPEVPIELPLGNTASLSQLFPGSLTPLRGASDAPEVVGCDGDGMLTPIAIGSANLTVTFADGTVKKFAVSIIDGEGEAPKPVFAEFVAGSSREPVLKVFNGRDAEETMSQNDLFERSGVYVAAVSGRGSSLGYLVFGSMTESVFGVRDANGHETMSKRRVFESGGVSVGAGDVRGEGHPIFIAGSTVTPEIVVYDVHGERIDALSKSGIFAAGGVYVAAVVRKTGAGFILVGSATRPDIAVYDDAGTQTMTRKDLFPEAPLAGISVASGDVDGDGEPDLIFGSLAIPAVKVLNLQGEVVFERAELYPNGGGVFVAAADGTGDQIADLAVASTLEPTFKVFTMPAGLETMSKTDFFDAGGFATLGASEINVK